MSELVVGIDGSACSVVALEWAVAEARLRKEDVRAVLAWAIEGRPVQVDATAGREESNAEAAAAALLHDTIAPVAARNPDVKIHERLLYQPPVAGLVQDAEYASMLVVGARGLGPLRRMLVGSVSASCALEADAPVVVVRSPGAPDQVSPAGGETGAVLPVLVGIDGSKASLVALAWAAEEAALRGTALHVIHTWMVPALAYGSGYYGPPLRPIEEAAQAVLDDAVTDALGTEPIVPVTAKLVEGHAARALIEAAADASLLVVGARGHGGFAGLTLGSTGHQCVVHAPGPVAVIRPPVRHASIT